MAALSVARPEEVSFPDRLRAPIRDLVLAGSKSVAYPAGEVVFRPGDAGVLAVLESGVARAFLSSSDGRQVTVRYIQPGELMGGVFVVDQTFPGSLQMLIGSSVCYLDIDGFRKLMATEVEVADALATELAFRLIRVQRIIAMQTFASVTQRVAFDLLERCCREQLTTGRLETGASQQELADGIGSVREVVARALRELSEKGMIATWRRHVRLVHPAGLTRLATAAFGET